VRSSTAAVAVVVLVAVMTAGCSSGTTPSSTIGTGPSPTTTASTTVPSDSTQSTTTLPARAPFEGLKPPIAGLVDRAAMPSDEYLEIVNAYVVDVTWNELQPTEDGAIAENNPIDAAVSDVRISNTLNGGDLSIKLRVRAGIDAPDWVKSLGGDAVEITDPQDDVGGTIGMFWTEEFGAAYAALQKVLADTYDDVPEIREVTISRCTTVYVEPFHRNIKDPASVESLLDAGFDSASDVGCLTAQIDAHDVWEHTRSGLAFNPYQVIEPDGATRVDLDVTLSVMSYCRLVLGDRCVLENNSIRWPPLEGRPGKMYDEMERLGPPYTFQTAAPTRVGDLGKTLEWAAGRGACAVELPRTYGEMLSTEQLEDYAVALSSNHGCR